MNNRTMFVNWQGHVNVFVKDVYGVEDPPIPEGYKAVAFRLCLSDEYYLRPDGSVQYGHSTSALPRIILQNDMPIRRTKYARLNDVYTCGLMSSDIPKGWKIHPTRGLDFLCMGDYYLNPQTYDVKSTFDNRSPMVWGVLRLILVKE